MAPNLIREFASCTSYCSRGYASVKVAIFAIPGLVVCVGCLASRNQVYCLVSTSAGGRAGYSNRSAFEELQALLASQAPALLEKINSLVSEIVFQRLEHRSECDVVAPPVQTRPPTNASAETVTVQPTKRGGSNSLDRRLGMATLRTTADKIMLLEEIEPTVPLRKSELTESARQFVNQILTPILTCYREHFCSDLAAFIGTWGANFSHSKLKTNCSVKNPCNT
uniref:Uncharacterized protein n=1 Tax=Spongospora subterranea TaxID=70186 RepID=A0A0H5QYU2_9EUKA|eukprot:CRZ06829.1 hypothetical protein [Spongospora subterranea]